MGKIRDYYYAEMLERAEAEEVRFMNIDREVFVTKKDWEWFKMMQDETRTVEITITSFKRQKDDIAVVISKEETEVHK